MKPFVSRPENVAAVDAIADTLKRLPIGNVVHYEDLNALAAKDVQAGGRYLLARAIALVEKETGHRFGIVTGRGVKRLADEEIPAVGSDYVRRTRRVAARGVKKMTGLSANLSESARTRIVGYRTVLSVAAAVTTMDSAKKAAAEAASPNAGDVQQLLKMKITR